MAQVTGLNRHYGQIACWHCMRVSLIDIDQCGFCFVNIEPGCWTCILLNLKYNVHVLTIMLGNIIGECLLASSKFVTVKSVSWMNLCIIWQISCTSISEALYKYAFYMCLSNFFLPLDSFPDDNLRTTERIAKKFVPVLHQIFWRNPIVFQPSCVWGNDH